MQLCAAWCMSMVKSFACPPSIKESLCIVAHEKIHLNRHVEEVFRSGALGQRMKTWTRGGSEKQSHEGYKDSDRKRWNVD